MGAGLIFAGGGSDGRQVRREVEEEIPALGLERWGKGKRNEGSAASAASFVVGRKKKWGSRELASLYRRLRLLSGGYVCPRPPPTGGGLGRKMGSESRVDLPPSGLPVLLTRCMGAREGGGEQCSSTKSGWHSGSPHQVGGKGTFDPTHVLHHEEIGKLVHQLNISPK